MRQLAQHCVRRAHERLAGSAAAAPIGLAAIRADHVLELLGRAHSSRPPVNAPVKHSKRTHQARRRRTWPCPRASPLAGPLASRARRRRAPQAPPQRTAAPRRLSNSKACLHVLPRPWAWLKYLLGCCHTLPGRGRRLTSTYTCERPLTLSARPLGLLWVLAKVWSAQGAVQFGPCTAAQNVSRSGQSDRSDSGDGPAATRPRRRGAALEKQQVRFLGSCEEAWR